MWSFGSILEGDWSSLYAQCSTEESEFMEQLIIDYCSIPNDLHFDSNFRIPSDNTNIYPNDNACFYPTSNHNSYYAGDFDHILATNVEILSCADIHENVLMQVDIDNTMANPVLHKDVVSCNPEKKSRKRSMNSSDVSINSNKFNHLLFFSSDFLIDSFYNVDSEKQEEREGKEESEDRNDELHK